MKGGTEGENWNICSGRPIPITHTISPKGHQMVAVIVRVRGDKPFKNSGVYNLGRKKFTEIIRIKNIPIDGGSWSLTAQDDDLAIWTLLEGEPPHASSNSSGLGGL